MGALLSPDAGLDTGQKTHAKRLDVDARGPQRADRSVLVAEEYPQNIVPRNPLTGASRALEDRLIDGSEELVALAQLLVLLECAVVRVLVADKVGDPLMFIERHPQGVRGVVQEREEPVLGSDGLVAVLVCHVACGIERANQLRREVLNPHGTFLPC